MSAFYRKLEAAGWEVTKSIAKFDPASESGECPAAAGEASKHGVSCEIPWTWIGRMSQEFLRVETVVEVLSAVSESDPLERQLKLVALAGESTLWD